MFQLSLESPFLKNLGRFFLSVPFASTQDIRTKVRSTSLHCKDVFQPSKRMCFTRGKMSFGTLLLLSVELEYNVKVTGQSDPISIKSK